MACPAALGRHTSRLCALGDARSRGQIMADTLAKRLTGQTAAVDVSLKVQPIVP